MRRKDVSFFREFLRDRHVAAVSPSSPHLMRRLRKHVDAPSVRRIIELGPGDGVAIRALLRDLPEGARYTAVERNPKFAAALTRLGDTRVEIVEGRAQDIGELFAGEAGTVDAIIASIPFTYLKKHERTALVASVKRLLRPGGTFVVFHQYSPLMVPYVAKEFGSVHVEFEPLNLFPCFLMVARK